MDQEVGGSNPPSCTNHFINTNGLPESRVGEKMDVIPHVPTHEEAGLPEYESFRLLMLLAPAGTPEEVVDTLSESLDKILDDPACANALRAGGLIPFTRSAEEVRELIVSEGEQWAKIIEDANKVIDD